MASIDRLRPHIRISLVAVEIDQATISDVGLFIYDFASLYELGRLATDPYYEYFQFSRFALYRNGRHLRSQDQMNIDKLRLESPMEVISTIAIVGGAAVAVAGAIWTITQTFEKIYNLPLNRRKLELEVQKLEREELAENRKNDSVISPDEAMRFLEERGASPYIDVISRRLIKAPIRAESLDVELIDPRREMDAQTLDDLKRSLKLKNLRKSEF